MSKKSEEDELELTKEEKELADLEPVDGIFTVPEDKWTPEQREAMKKLRTKYEED